MLDATPAQADPGRVTEANPTRPDPEVPERAHRRTFTARYKLDVLRRIRARRARSCAGKACTRATSWTGDEPGTPARWPRWPSRGDDAGRIRGTPRSTGSTRRRTAVNEVVSRGNLPVMKVRVRGGRPVRGGGRWWAG